MIKSSMQSDKKVLIIDDHLRIADVFKSNLELLNKNLVISILPTAEEALLEISKTKFDLIIADILLPGISGFELLKIIKTSHPEIKVFIVSGVADPEVKKQIAKAKADAFFYKPVDFAEFLDAVERSLGFIGTILVPELQLEIEEPEDIQSPGLQQKLSALKQELNADAVFLIGKVGQILMSDGDLPSPDFDSNFIPKISRLINKRELITEELISLAPRNFHNFRISNYDVLTVRFISSYLLMIILKKDQLADLSSFYQSADGIYSNLMKIGATSVLNPADLDGLDLFLDNNESRPESSDALLSEALESDVNPEDVDSFWEEFNSRKPGTSDVNTGSLSFEQAKDLGVSFSKKDKP
jgi:DNA-binding NarL/FixJ family response regulator